jgi:hypothetical protein
MSLAKVTGAFPSELQGTLGLTAAVAGSFTIGNWVYVGTWGSETFKGKIVKCKADTSSITVKKISGSLSSGAALKERTGVTSGSSGSDTAATATLDTINTATIGLDVNGAGGLDINYTGWNLRETTQGITRSKIVDTSPLRIIAEVLVAQRNLSGKRTDIGTVATFTLTAITSTGPYDVSAGDKITFTITSTEGVVFDAGTTFPFEIDTGVSKNAVYVSSNAAKTVHTFAYAVVTGDINADADIIVAAGNFTGTVYDIVDGNNVKITAPVSVTGTSLTQLDSVVQA